MAGRSNKADEISSDLITGTGGTKSRGATITKVKRGSIADELGLQPGDRLVCVNGHRVRDLLEYSYLIQQPKLDLVVARSDDEVIMCDVEKDESEDLGIAFSDTLFDGIMQCHNNCLFCFVRQNPRGVRPSLCIKDDDPRLSFLHGNYISLTNLSDDHFNMLLRMRMSPLYISVHSTDPSVRRRLMGYGRNIDIMGQLSALTSAGIIVHCQIVLCPGFNDRSDLIRTVRDLFGLHPGIASVAVVPVGLTSHRESLPFVELPSRAVAVDTLHIIKRLQEDFLRSAGTRFVFASDEFFFLAESQLPDGIEYEQYQQIENGVGLTRKMSDEFNRILKDRGLPASGDGHAVSLLTGVLGAQALEVVLSALPYEDRQRVHVIPIENSFFGAEVTVTGLISGRDVLRGVQETGQASDASKPAKPVVVIPDVMLNDDGLFVDDLSIDYVRNQAAQLDVDLRVVKSGADGLYFALTTTRGVRNAR